MGEAGLGVKGVRDEFEPHQVEMKTVGEGRRCRNMKQGEKEQQSREEMGSMRGRGASLLGWLAGWLAVWVK